MKKVTKKVAKKKVNKTTHISVILDRSGSMASIKNDIIGGFNTFLELQKKSKNKITLSLVQFDTENHYEVIHDMQPIKNISELTPETFVPRGGTPLLDTLGKSIGELEGKIVHMKKGKPDNVVVVIITDGQENASHEYRKDQIAKIIKDRQDAGWQFVFLSADLNAIGDASAYGITRQTTMAYDANAKGTSNMFRSLSMNVTAYASGITKCCAFSDEDRAKQSNEKKVTTK